MKSFLAAGLLLFAAACTTLRPVDALPEEIQRQIVSESLLKPGDKVRLVTNDGATHDFTVASVDPGQGVVNGEHEAVRISDIARLGKRTFSALKTGLLAAGAFFGAGVLTARCVENCDVY
jgi:hypothetical protein